jgi:hypothetical protein
MGLGSMRALLLSSSLLAVLATSCGDDDGRDGQAGKDEGKEDM